MRLRSPYTMAALTEALLGRSNRPTLVQTPYSGETNASMI